MPRHPWDLVIAGVAGVVLLVLVAFAAIVAVPPALANLHSRIGDGATSVAIGSGGAQVVVPDGWVVAAPSADEVRVRTPDGAMTASLRSDGASLDDALRSAITRAAGTDAHVAVGPARAETLASGAEIRDADVGSHTVAAALASRGTSVEVVATVVDGAELTAYRAALAQLLESVRP